MTDVFISQGSVFFRGPVFSSWDTRLATNEEITEPSRAAKRKDDRFFDKTPRRDVSREEPRAAS